MLGLDWLKIHLRPWKGYAMLRNEPYAVRKEYIDRKLENPERAKWVWIIFVAGIGFAIDAYSIWSINMVYPMLGLVYFDGHLPQAYLVALNICTLGGTIVGQIGFGLGADRYGRRKMYGKELYITIIGSVGCALASTGTAGSMSVIGWLCFFRFILGLGIGADYPLSACLCSEMASTRLRDRMLTAVFAFQPLGQLIATVVALICVFAARHALPRDTTTCTTDGCLKAVDICWRLILGFGAILAGMVLYFRLTIIESPLYTLEVEKDSLGASAAVYVYYGGGRGTITRRNTIPTSAADSTAAAELNHIPTNSTNGPHTIANGHSNPASPVREVVNPSDGYHVFNQQPRLHGALDSQGTQSAQQHPSDNRRVASVASLGWSDQSVWDNSEHQFWSMFWFEAKNYFWHEGNLRTLIATAISWACIDLPFYGLGTSSTQILRKVWSIDSSAEPAVYDRLLQTAWQSMLVVQLGEIVGVIITLCSIRWLGPRWIQMIGFAALFVLFIVIASSYDAATRTNCSIPIVVLYVFCQVFYNFGPNTTTFILPAEVFPTRFRCTSHGLSAATGKFGSVIAQILIGFWSGSEGYEPAPYFRYFLFAFSPFMLIGLAITYWWIPDTRGRDGQPQKLSKLAEGRQSEGFSETKRARAVSSLYHMIFQGIIMLRDFRWSGIKSGMN